MKKFKICLEFQGFVLFDPFVLSNFIKEKKINTENVFEYFIENPIIGIEVINRGIILPIYSIPVFDYTIIANNGESQISTEYKIFNINKFGLNIESNKVIFADIYTIMSWDDESFFLNYENNYQFKSDTNDYFKIPNGKYKVEIIGYRENTKNNISDPETGYEFIFTQTDKIPQLSDDDDIESINYNVLEVFS